MLKSSPGIKKYRVPVLCECGTYWFWFNDDDHHHNDKDYDELV